MRNTYNDTRIPGQNQNPRNLHNSRERVTYTANQNRVQSLQKHGNTNNNHEKMTKKII